MNAVAGSNGNAARKTGYEPRPEAAGPRVSIEIKVVGTVIGLALLAFLVLELAK